MIVVKLMGGLGNQMFQYATAKRLALKNKTELKIDLSWFDNVAQVDTPRFYELDCFWLKPLFIKPESFTIVEKKGSVKSRVKFHLKSIGKIRLVIHKEKNPGFQRELLSLPDDTYLEGFWQSDKYFRDIREDIIKDFLITVEPGDKNQKLLDKISKTGSISLHVRRGDYAKNKEANKFHGLTGLEYYEAAIQRIAKTVKNPHFFVISDDPAWCKKNLKIPYPSEYVSHNEKGFQDMRLMTACKHHIIANSSFSWWGAWLDDKPGKIVIAPKQWFADEKANKEIEIVPKEWIRL